MLTSPLISLTLQKSITQILRYLAILLTTALGIYALRIETVRKSTDPNVPNQFTRSGRKYLGLLIVLTFFSTGVSIWDDHVDTKVKKEAEQVGNEQTRRELEQSNKELIASLRPAIEEQKRQISSAVTVLNKGVHDATGGLDRSLRDSSTKMESRLRNAVDDMAFSGVELDFIGVDLIPDKLSMDKRALSKWRNPKEAPAPIDAGAEPDSDSQIEQSLYSVSTSKGANCFEAGCKGWLFSNHRATTSFANHFWRGAPIEWLLKFRRYLLTVEVSAYSTPSLNQPVRLLHYPCVEVFESYHKDKYLFLSSSKGRNVSFYAFANKIFGPFVTKTGLTKADADIDHFDAKIWDSHQQHRKQILAMLLAETFRLEIRAEPQSVDEVMKHTFLHPADAIHMKYRAVPKSITHEDFYDVIHYELQKLP